MKRINCFDSSCPTSSLTSPSSSSSPGPSSLSPPSPPSSSSSSAGLFAFAPSNVSFRFAPKMVTGSGRTVGKGGAGENGSERLVAERRCRDAHGGGALYRAGSVYVAARAAGSHAHCTTRVHTRATGRFTVLLHPGDRCPLVARSDGEN
uniref:Uncharacterized protein n=1 Tax=Anopheles coluzzii TaxID=1518534 RepID=A0A8W7P550_ANOCL